MMENTTGGYDPKPTIELWESKRKKNNYIICLSCQNPVIKNWVMVVENNITTYYCKECYKDKWSSH